MKNFLFLLFIIPFFPNCANAHQKYYFSSQSASEGYGTREHPFTSLQKLSQLNLQPGDTVFFKSGDTLPGTILLHHIHGTERNDIIFTSYGKARGIINGGDKEAFAIDSSDHFKIINLIMIGNGRKTGNTANGLKMLNCKNAFVKNVDISGFQKSGLLLYDCQMMGVNGVFAHENGAGGILVEGDHQKRISNHIHIINCSADDNPGDPTNLTNHSGNGILVGNCKNVVIEYCTATNNGWDMPRIGNGPVGIWAYEADSVIIQHCISYRNKTAKGAADGGGFDLDGGVTNSIIQYCLSYENWGSGYGIYQYWSAGRWNNNTLRYCISINDGYETDGAAAMIIWNGWNGDSTFTHFYAYNNFFYNDKKYAFSFSPLSEHKRFVFFNNIFVASDTCNIYNGIDSSLNDIYLGNVWMRKNGGFVQNGFTDLKNWSKATGYEQRNGRLAGYTVHQKLFSLPDSIDITDPYSLQTNSFLRSLCRNVLRNKGININKLFFINKGGRDFFGSRIHPDKDNTPGICRE